MVKQIDVLRITHTIEGVYFADYIAKLKENEQTKQEVLLWKYALSYDPRQGFKKQDGKWVIHRRPEELRRIVEEILFPHIKDKKLNELKYRPTLNDPRGLWKDLLPPLCVYDTDSRKHESQELLLSLGFHDIYWQSEQATRERRV